MNTKYAIIDIKKATHTATVNTKEKIAYMMVE